MSDGIFWNDAIMPGVRLLEGAYGELRKPAEVKGILTTEWQDEHGTDRQLAGRFLATRKLNLPVMVEGGSETEYNSRYMDLQAWLLEAGYFKLKVERLNRIFTLLYDGINEYRDNYDYCTFQLQLLDDYPQIVEKIWP